MKYQLISFLILFCIVLQACNHCEKVSLNDTDKAWVAHFTKGQVFIFKDLKGQVDSLEVVDIQNLLTPCNKIELSMNQFEKYCVLFIFKSKSNYNNIESSICVTTESWKKRIPYIYIGNLGPHRNDVENIIPTPIDTTLAGKHFTSVYQYSKDLNTEQYGEIEAFKGFYWDKQVGLVAYETSKGEFFMRIN